MRTLYLECNMGAAGDMLTAALLELLPDPESFVERLNHIGLPGVTYQAEQTEKCGIVGTHMKVLVNGVEEECMDLECEHSHEHEHGHEHSHEHGHGHDHSHEHEHGHEHGHGHIHQAHTHHSLHDIEHIVFDMQIPDKVKADVLAVYRLIAEAEASVHGKPVDEIHFHEVGTMDAVADVTAVCMLINELAPEQIIATPVHVGSGHVHCAHGILPVPAPATAKILQGIPTYSGEVKGELCTPTGAALLKHFVNDYCSQPIMRVSKIGYGCGKKDFEQANVVRASIGESENCGEKIVELCCNLDDMTPEAVAFAMESLFAAGAADVYTMPIGMKKNRPGILLTCMCTENKREEMLKLIFKHTTTLGVREYLCNRYVLERTMDCVETPYGEIRVKKASGYGVCREKPEYEDVAAIARAQKMSLAEAGRLVDRR